MATANPARGDRRGPASGCSAPPTCAKEVSALTAATIALTELAEEGADALHQIVRFMAQGLVELDVARTDWFVAT